MHVLWSAMPGHLPVEQDYSIRFTPRDITLKISLKSPKGLPHICGYIRKLMLRRSLGLDHLASTMGHLPQIRSLVLDAVQIVPDTQVPDDLNFQLKELIKIKLALCCQWTTPLMFCCC